MIIRQATPADVPVIAEFESEIARVSFPENPIDDPEVHRKKLGKALARAPEGMFVAQIDGQTVGWLWITLNTSFTTGERYATLRSLAVHPGWRGSGIGRSLVSFAIDYCREGGARWIAGKVHVDNARMRALFRATGFHPKHLAMEFRLEGEAGDGAENEADNDA
jgi:ribosomal protein S18 acetylase RimI-like enzyme